MTSGNGARPQKKNWWCLGRPRRRDDTPASSKWIQMKCWKYLPTTLGSTLFAFGGRFLQFLLVRFSPTSLTKLTSLLEATQELANLYCPGQLSVLQLLTLLHWLSEYPTWDRMSQVWKADPKTLRDHINSSLLALYDNLSEVPFHHLKDFIPHFFCR